MTRKLICVSINEEDYKTLEEAKNQDRRTMSSFMHIAGIERAKQVLSSEETKQDA